MPSPRMPPKRRAAAAVGVGASARRPAKRQRASPKPQVEQALVAAGFRIAAARHVGAEASPDVRKARRLAVQGLFELWSPPSQRAAATTPKPEIEVPAESAGCGVVSGIGEGLRAGTAAELRAIAERAQDVG
mmetsp:Transcript_67029/g.218226  ORF Transcript_67029/g.218226 Transcript_67029/m.218226 type:complete len:132 (+) Transcript_67029:28-423(+)